jgi:hypothetical protein
MRVRIVNSGPGWALIQVRPGQLLTLTGFPGNGPVLSPGQARLDWSATPPKLVDMAGRTMILDPLGCQFRVEVFLAHRIWEMGKRLPESLTQACIETGAEAWEVRFLDLALQGQGFERRFV